MDIFFNRIKEILLILVVITLGLGSCDRFRTKASIPGIDESLAVDGISFLVVKASIRQSYSIQYIMYYPDKGTTFYVITTTIQGFDEPREALIWGENNITLGSKAAFGQFVYAYWTIIGEGIRYESGADFEYQYVFVYEITTNDSYEQYFIQLPGGLTIDTSTILVTSSFQNTTNEDVEQQTNATTEPEGEIKTSDLHSVLSGGSLNKSSAYHTTVGGGYLNIAQTAYGTVSGGRENIASGLYTTIGGGYGNEASGRDAAIGGGSRNIASNYHTTVSGGIRNQASASDTTISGGGYNHASQPYATVGGGTQNEANGSGSVVCGGAGNIASEDLSSVAGGLGNQATGIYATVGGGQENFAGGAYSTVPGGSGNHALGDFSLATGHRALVSADQPGVFLFADSLEVDFTSNNPNEFGVRATGGVRFVSGVDNQGEPVAGVLLSPGGGSWSNLSDQSQKENIKAINQLEILESVVALPITEWNYRSQDASVRHIGPMAQDFNELLNIGEDDHHINSLDADGVALASIQGLFQILKERNDQLSILENRLTKVEQRMQILIALLIVVIITYPIIFWIRWKHTQNNCIGQTQSERLVGSLNYPKNIKNT